MALYKRILSVSLKSSDQITITVKQSSPADLVLTSLLKDEGDEGSTPFLIENKDGSTVFSSRVTGISRTPDKEDDESGETRWTIDV